MQPLKILLIEPGGESLAAAVESALEPLQSKGWVRIARVKPASERSIEEMLRAEPCQIIHFIGQGTSRPAARYGTLTLQGSDGRPRSINAENFARLATRSNTPNLIVFQAIAQQSPLQNFEVVTQALLNAGLPAAMWIPDFSAEQANAVFIREFYGRFVRGTGIELAMNAAKSAIAASGALAGQRANATDDSRHPVLHIGATSATSAAPAALPPPQPQPQPQPQAVAPTAENNADTEALLAAQRKKDLKLALERRRAAGEFDVFLCHNVGDKPAVKEIGLKLREAAVLPWLDEWELRPGMPWQRLLEEQIGNIRSAAVFVGREGIGPWQRQELDGFLREFAQRNCPVIPVLLPGAPVQPRLPLFLEGMTWVDFRVQSPDPMARLLWGITGRAPEID